MRWDKRKVEKKRRRKERKRVNGRRGERKEI